MKKLRAHLAFLKMKAPTLKVYINYFQQKVPHVTQAHDKMESLMYYLGQNSHLTEEDLEFCFEGDNFSCEERKELVLLVNSAFSAAHEKLQKYVVKGAQPALKFLEQIQEILLMQKVASMQLIASQDLRQSLETNGISTKTV